MQTVNVIGAGLAGCEAAYQLAIRGVAVQLFDMKPEKKTPAHKSELFSELVCSNSLRAANVENAVGLLKEEMRRLGSLVMQAADATQVSAGGALAVDRERFSEMITKTILENRNIKFVSKEVTEIPEGEITIIATGPLTSDALFQYINTVFGAKNLHFFDAAAPIVTADSLEYEKVFFASRYGRGTPDYINCPMTKEEYEAFYNALSSAEMAELHEFDRSMVFEGCLPIEVMAARGVDTLRYGPMKPVGLIDPHTGKEPYAVVQLRKDNRSGTLYNLVGFQTHMKFPEQKRVFSLIPGLEHAEFARYGVMHRNTFLNSPELLNSFYQLKTNPNLYFAGQMNGVEGYVESAASGLLCGIHAARHVLGLPPVDFPNTTSIGSLAHYVSDESVGQFQPMNVNFGIMAPPDFKFRGKRDKNTKLAARALSVLEQLIKQNSI